MARNGSAAFVTGGSRGIGRSIVARLVKDGIPTAFTYVGNEEAMKETMRLAAGQNADVALRAYRMDVRNAAEVESVAEKAMEDFGSVGVVVNNAGVIHNNVAAMMTDEQWQDVIATDLSGPFFVIRSFLSHMMGKRWGRIVNISSLAQEGSSGQANYAAAKAGLIGLTKTLAREYGPRGITSNVVTVGYVETDMTDAHMAQKLHDIWLEYCPIKRIGSAEEISSLVSYLAGDEAGFINGEVIRVAGGLSYVP
ncbi:MAG TPA: SDR family oxidoreductase [Spirochaetia bacterium]|nr:SDR family oxidoreductase [Spirochaetia bacterium]